MPNFQDTVFIYEHLSPIFKYVLVCLKPIFAQCCITYRNQSPDLKSKTNDWFLHERPHWAEMG